MSNRTNGQTVKQFEQAFAQYVGAKYAVAVSNGTASLHTALVALGVKPGERVAVPPLTMASTTLAVLHARAVPVYVDVHRDSWTMHYPAGERWAIPVSLYGLWSGAQADWEPSERMSIDDAAQTLNKHTRGAAFTSYSFQASKILSAGEGGMLVTDSPELALLARGFSNLGYPGDASPYRLKRPDFKRHLQIGYNYRMADCQAALLLPQLERGDAILAARKYSADCYRQAIQGCAWITPQHVPEGWPHSWWTFALACDSRARADALQTAIVQQGGELCYRAWRITYTEPALRHLAPDGTCPVAEDLQPRICQLQTNHDAAGAEHAAECLKQAIASCGF